VKKGFIIFLLFFSWSFSTPHPGETLTPLPSLLEKLTHGTCNKNKNNLLELYMLMHFTNFPVWWRFAKLLCSGVINLRE